MTLLKNFPFELVVWVGALIILGVSPVNLEHHFSLCPLNNFGFNFCPGCGLGKAITLLFNGEIKQSFNAHPMGLFAAIILSFRIIQLTKNYFKLYGQNN